MYIKDLAIIGKPVQTEIGTLHPFKVGEYDEFIRHSMIINLDKNGLLHSIENIEIIAELLQSIDMFYFIKLMSNEEYKGSFLYDLYIGYKDLFKASFKEDVFEKIKTNDEFDYYINLIREANGIDYEPTSPNPEVERRKELKRKLMSMKNENVTFEDKFTSVCVGLNKLPSEVNEMTIYSFNKIFERIVQFKNYDTSTLFATVSADVKIEPWYKTHIERDEAQYITEEQLNRAKQDKQLQTNL